MKMLPDGSPASLKKKAIPPLSRHGTFLPGIISLKKWIRNK
jgi:hypothetical protein